MGQIETERRVDRKRLKRKVKGGDGKRREGEAVVNLREAESADKEIATGGGAEKC